jgi:NAD-dependent dihydropyrimidine dehydrogenase PreA subunit
VSYVITAACVDTKDRSCIDVCPVDCIHEAARMLVIDPEECIDCGACEPECPVEAIHAEDDLAPDAAAWAAIGRGYAGGGIAPVDRAVDELVPTSGEGA